MYMSKSFGDYCHLSGIDVVLQVKSLACFGSLIILSSTKINELHRVSE